jgi:hypothetical protein
MTAGVQSARHGLKGDRDEGRQTLAGFAVDRDASEALLQFRSAVADPRHQPDPYVLNVLARRLEAFKRQSAHIGFSAEFIRRMQESFVAAFRLLDALPRDHPFWDRTNRRPTQHRLYDFCQGAIEGHADRIPALRMTASVEVIQGLSFNPRTWMRLQQATPVDIGWPIYAAFLGEYWGGNRTVPLIVGLLTEIDPTFTARSELAWMVLSEDSYVSGWARRVRDGLRPRSRERNG